MLGLLDGERREIEDGGMQGVTGRKKREAVCYWGCVYAGGPLLMQISITFTEIMLFYALLSLKMPNLNSSFDEYMAKLRT